MRLLKVLLTGLFAAFAVVAGLVVAAVIALVFAIRRLLGNSHPSHRPTHRRARTTAAQASDVIEVTATEVPAEPPSR